MSARQQTFRLPHFTVHKMRSLAACVGLAIVPVALNLAIWRGWLVPKQARVRLLQEASVAASAKPELASLLKDSQGLAAQWKGANLGERDAFSATRRVEQIAASKRVTIMTISAKPGQQGSVPIEVEATGRFNPLARWLAELEAQAGLQVDEWSFAPPDKPGQPERLKIELTAKVGA